MKHLAKSKNIEGARRPIRYDCQAALRNSGRLYAWQGKDNWWSARI